MTIKTVLVLGANSFSGQDFIDLLLDDPRYSVVGISRSSERPPIFLRHATNPNLARYRFYQLDVNEDWPELFALFDSVRPNWIVNFAALSEVAPSWDLPDQWFATNAVALARIVNHLRRANYLERFLQISSPEAYGSCAGHVTEYEPDRPSTPYAVSKAAGDMLLKTYHQQFDFPALTVRATNVYGARQQLHKIIPRSAICLTLGRRIPLHGGGKAVKSYIHIRDVSRGELDILQKGVVGERYHLSPDSGISIHDLVQRICTIAGKDFEASIDRVDERLGQDAAYLIDSSKARARLGWQPRIDLDTGIREVLSWIEANWACLDENEFEYRHRQ